VHHTNEIAQSEAATGQRFANHWLHSNHVMVNGDKISKSLGNGIRLQEIIAKGFSPAVVRLLVLESHYRSQSKFSWDALEAARNRLQTLQALADLRWQQPPRPDDAVRQAEFIELASQTIPAKITECLLNDLNTPQALAILSEYEPELVSRYDASLKDALVSFMTWLNEALGLDLLASEDITLEQKQLFAERQAARYDKEWAKSDALRDKLAAQGIGVNDTEHGAIWYRQFSLQP
jgi:cysteinyl-tRNA synthetase